MSELNDRNITSQQFLLCETHYFVLNQSLDFLSPILTLGLQIRHKLCFHFQADHFSVSFDFLKSFWIINFRIFHLLLQILLLIIQKMLQIYLSIPLLFQKLQTNFFCLLFENLALNFLKINLEGHANILVHLFGFFQLVIGAKVKAFANMVLQSIVVGSHGQF